MYEEDSFSPPQFKSSPCPFSPPLPPSLPPFFFFFCNTFHFINSLRAAAAAITAPPRRILQFREEAARRAPASDGSSAREAEQGAAGDRDPPYRGQARRHVTFTKRRAGLFRKASELSILTGAAVAVLVFSEANRPYTLTDPSSSLVDDAVLRSRCYAPAPVSTTASPRR